MKNIVIAGVGGQGTLLASMVLGQIALLEGFDVALSEVHGMAQRGGSVVTYVRMGDNNEKVYSSTIEECSADILLAFEQLEAIRWMPYLKKDGLIIANTQKILPMPVITGVAQYPPNIIEDIKKHYGDAVFVDALQIAEQLKNVKTVNIILLGVLAKHMNIKREVWEQAIKNVVKEKFIGLNLEAFKQGYEVL